MPWARLLLSEILLGPGPSHSPLERPHPGTLDALLAVTVEAG